MCSCTRAKILYQCTDLDCPNHAQSTYCECCQNDKVHNHFPQEMIIKIIMKAYEEWETENKRYEDLAALATISYKKIETIIVSLESETLRVPTNQLSQNS